MGKLTISTGPFSSSQTVSHCQRATTNHLLRMGWFSISRATNLDELCPVCPACLRFAPLFEGRGAWIRGEAEPRLLYSKHCAWLSPHAPKAIVPQMSGRKLWKKIWSRDVYKWFNHHLEPWWTMHSRRILPGTSRSFGSQVCTSCWVTLGHVESPVFTMNHPWKSTTSGAPVYDSVQLVCAKNSSFAVVYDMQINGRPTS